MARKIKELVLEDGDKIPIKLDSTTGIFSAYYIDKRYECKSLEDIERDIIKRFKNNRAIQYQPVIIVSDPTWKDNSQLGFDYERMFRAKRLDGTFAYRCWEHVGTPPDGGTWDDCLEGKAGNETHEPFGSQCKTIPYDTRRWLALRHIENQMELLREKLKDILLGKGSEAFLENVADNKPQLLPFQEALKNE